jgi:hypothetical protein
MLRCYWDDGVVIECVVSGVWLWLGVIAIAIGIDL